ncbi:non-ribosomal peptide synthetase [Chitinophaga vietnamensis]|uniref:non-ribosomal peptide synthetase n=1 Tax=Chitinophaga vietnamensis TaxID=2593957 RepID=UPI0011A8E46B|nr:non-ribosomal peptide synthetase [Chitinophaga vietnamensis]
MFFLPANQRVIWFDQKLFPHSALYNVCFYTHIRGNIEAPLFENALNILIAQHDALRSVFSEIDGIPRLSMPAYDAAQAYPLMYIDLSGQPDSQQACMEWMERETAIPLPFAENKLYAFTLLKQADNSFYWYAKVHHTLTDGWGTAVLVHHLAAIYESLAKGATAAMTAAGSYAAYIREDEAYTRSEAFKADEQYWQERFATIPPPLSAGIRDGKKEELLLQSVRRTEVIDQSFYQSIRQLAADNKVTTFHVFLGICYVYFSRIQQVDDLVMGVPVLNRSNDVFLQTPGNFVGIMPFRMQFENTLTFKALLPQIRNTFLKDLVHQRFPMDEIIRIVKTKEPETLTLFDISLSFEKQSQSLLFNGFETEVKGLHHRAEKTPLGIFVRECQSDDDIQIDFDFNTGHWDEYYIDQFLQQFRLLLHALVSAPEQAIGEVPLVTPATREALLRKPAGGITHSGTLVSRFEAAVQQYPDQPALVFEGRRYTYTELNAAANQLAHHLREHYRVRPNEIIAMMVPKSDTAIITILGILKSGAAYLPIDPDYPDERKRFTLADSGARLLITESRFGVPAFSGEVWMIDEWQGDSHAVQNPEPVNTSDDISYIIYTSGSTGKPKGAVIRHSGAVNVVVEYEQEIRVRPEEHCLQFASLSFDGSVLEIFIALFSGAALYPVSKDTITDYDSFASFLEAHRIAYLILPPSYLRNLNKAALAPVRALVTAGEPAIPRSELHLRDDQEYYNAYGPTECSVCTTVFKETANINRNVPIGKAIGNMQVYILDQHRQLLPYGVPGEIYIAGAGLAKGYLNNPVLTAEKFIPSPFEPGERLYRSGDVGRWLSDGNIEYLGRADDQVKIRGHRIEPGEIEAVLAQHPEVQNVSVVVKEISRNEKVLYAFVVPAKTITGADLHAFLEVRVPHFLIPDRIILLSEIPLTINGKVDKRKLLADVKEETAKTYTAPETAYEKAIAEVWQQLLGLQQISITDNFFQLGGHSLKVGKFINLIFKKTGIRLLFSEVFRAAQLKDIAALMEARQSSTVADITKAPERDYHPQSSSQKRHYLLHQAEGSKNSYNIPRAFRIKGQLDMKRLEDSFLALIKRHEAFRTAFEMRDGMPVQLIKAAVPFRIGYSKALKADKQQLLRDFVRTFDLATPPLLRAHLYEFEDGEQYFIYDIHHIISDGMSAALFTEELARLYQGETLEPLSIQYKDFAVWQHELLNTGAFKEQEQYWLQQFADEVPVLNLQTDFPRPAQKTFQGGRCYSAIDEATCTRLEQLATSLGSTLNQLLLAAFKVLQYKYAGNEDIVTGTPVAGRTHAELEKVMGVFINTLAIRAFPKGDKTFPAFLAEVSQASIEGLKHQDYPFELLIDKLNIRRDSSRNPLFDVMFSFIHEDNISLTLGDALLEPESEIYDTAKFDMLLEAIRTRHGIFLNLEYSSDLFTADTAEGVLQRYHQLLRAIVARPNQLLSQLQVLDETEQAALLGDDNDAAYPQEATLHQLFETQVQRHPQRTALVWGEEEMSYQTLNEKANRVAAAIQAALPGVHNPVVAVLLPRGMDMIITLMGILKAGAAYLPIDPDYPQDRISYMLEDSNTPLLISHSAIDQAFQGSRLYVDQLPAQTFAPVQTSADDLAYIIYTSGSTGQPKGAMITHRNVVRLLFNDKNLFDFSENDTWTLFHSYCFDFSVWEMYGALLYGGKLVLIPKTVAQNAREFLQLLQQQQVTVLNQTPGAFYQLISAAGEQPDTALALRYVIFGGEALKPGKLKAWHAQYPACRLINMYGITETTVHVTYKEITQQEIDTNVSNIGKPIPTLSMLLLDKDRQLTPPGAAGELHVAGAGLARGYLNRPALTAERFIDHPFRPGQKLYRTGDLARMLPNGEFEYLGRIDHQVKIRGFRIELGEIENKLMAHPEVKDVLVIDREDRSGDRYLCAYVAAGSHITATDLRKHLSAFLPDYMVPAFFIVMDHFPLTSNGKTDRSKLPLPEDTLLSAASYEAPETATEKQLAALWVELLHVQRVGLNDHFFELGGHSLKAVNAVARIFQLFQVNVPLNIFFTRPTVKEQAAFIDRQQKEQATPLLPAPARPHYPQSSSQKRLYLLHQIEGSQNSYNMPQAFRIKGQIDLPKLERCFAALIQRHEALRTAFIMKDGTPIQVIKTAVPFSIGHSKALASEQEQLLRDFVQTFDLAAPPLLRAHLYEFEDGEQLFIFDMHHIISDAVSSNLFTSELIRLYNDIPLEPVKIQYKDFSVWQQQLLKTGALKEQEQYWRQQLAGEVPVLSLQTDFPRPAQKTFNGKRLYHIIDTALSTQLEQLAVSAGSTLNQLLLAAFNVLLYKYAGNNDIITGTPVAGRTRAELNNIMGVFINTLAIRTFPAGDKTFKSFLSEVSKTSVEALKHQDYPFELLIEQLDLKRDMSRNPLFDVMFSFIHDETVPLTLGDALLEPVPGLYDIAKFDLLLDAARTKEHIILNLEYSTDLFETATAESFLQRYRNLLEAIAATPDELLSQLNILDKTEQADLLGDDNDATYPQQATLHQLFETQVQRHPQRTALVWGEEEMSYQTLNEKANRVAAAIQAALPGVHNPVVAVLLPRGMDMIITLMGILKAGAAYLPIDPDYPQDRISYMLEDSNTPLLISHSAIDQAFQGSRLYVDQLPAQTFAPVQTSADDLAYIIYTSGSTGQPKGAMITHRNVVRLLFNDKNLFDFSENDTWTLFHSYCFDFSVWEMYGALLYGGKLVLIPKTVAQNAREFLQLLHQQQVTVLNQTPGAFYQLISAAGEQPDIALALRYVIFGGEALKPGKLKAWHAQYPACRLINMYGITETTVHVTYKEITQQEIDTNVSNIGKPIPTLSMLLLDKDRQLTPPGAAGELHVAGAGLARGYLNRPALTAERFIDHPFRPGQKLYRTGDLARMLPNGEFEYLGRIDHQVKIRGFRIELGEIENKLMAHPEVKDVLVIDREDRSGDRYLCAYVAAGSHITATDLRKHLSAFLPDYMVPAFFIVMDHFPLTSNGKTDRSKLPLPEDTLLSAASYEAPETATEKQLAALWVELLHVQRVGLNDHFFELGGHSLKAVQLAALIHKHFQTDISIRQIFTTPGLREMAAFLQQSMPAASRHIPKAAPAAWYPASSAEKRLFILNQIDGAGIHYNIPAAYAIEGKVDSAQLTNAIRQLVRRHEILRTAFAIRQGEVIQIIQEHIDFDLETHHCEEAQLERFVQDFVQPFDLTRAPLFRACLVQTGKGQYFLLDLHHIIADGVAIDNLLRELTAAYNGAALPGLEIQTRDFAVWQQQWLHADTVQPAKKFWLSQFEQETTPLNMPTDFVRPPLRSYEGALYPFAIPQQVSNAIKQISSSNGATTFMVMLAAYNILLSKYSGQEDIIIGTPVSGRSSADVQPLLGMFVNTLPLRGLPAADKKFSAFLQEIKDLSLRAFEYQDYPFETLLDDLDITRDMSRNPLFDHLFTYRAASEDTMQWQGLQLKAIPVQHTISKMDLSLQISGNNNGLEGCIEYATRLYSNATVAKLAGHFLHILEQISEDPDILLKDIVLITEQEKAKILQYNQTAHPSPAKDLYALFEMSVDLYPDHIAVQSGDMRLTYRELEQQVSRIADILVAKGCRADSIIALHTGRSVGMIAAMLAIIKAGGAWMPVDTEYPEERIRYMLEDSQALLVITEKQYAAGLSYMPQVVLLDELSVAPAATYKNVRNPNDLAYIIYTSGSTGKPKGVMIEHHSFYNTITANAANYRSGFGPGDACLSLSNISFDASIIEIFIPLVHGARLVLLQRDNVYDVQSLARVITEQQITFCYVPPSLLQPLYKALSGHGSIALNKLFVGVEPIKDTTLQQYMTLNEKMEIINGYGPTEAAVDCTSYRFEPGNPRGVNVPIGKPLRNARIYIVNEQLQLQPEGIPGELCIAGEGLARGYLHNPALTSEKFVDNPFEPGQKLYHSGDLARWMPDGNIQFIGRKDHQVKIRGFRIELGEIESRLMKHPDIKQALVMDKTDGSGNKYLCAYVVSPQALDATALRAHLAITLPAYMIPSYFIVMEKFPLTSNEKIDRKALPAPDTAQHKDERVLPANATETKLLQIWETVLETNRISTTDNFFEIGGNSLRIINMLSMIKESFGDVLKVSDLFDKPTIIEQAAVISKHQQTSLKQTPSKAKRVQF